MPVTVTVTVNGKKYTLDIDDDTPLLWAIHDEIGLTGTKFGCGIAQCGACTVFVDGSPVRSCVTQVSRRPQAHDDVFGVFLCAVHRPHSVFPNLLDTRGPAFPYRSGHGQRMEYWRHAGGRDLSIRSARIHGSVNAYNNLRSACKTVSL